MSTMTMSDESDNGPGSSPHVQSAGPAIIQLLPSEAIGNIVARTNEIISEHRRWLANLPPRDTPTRSIGHPPSSLVTPPPTLSRRLAGPSPLPDPLALLPECSSLVTSASSAGFAAGAVSVSNQLLASLANESATAAASIASLQAALTAANNALNSARASAQQALGSASQSVQQALQSASIQSQAALAAKNSLTAGIASAQTSANQAIAAVQSTASANVLSANNALTSVQASASQAVASANAVASDARATATNAIAQAEATISAVASQASATIAASRISAMNSTVFVLVVTFAILGSSLISVLLFYLIIRYRRSRKLRKQDELKSSIRRKGPESDVSSIGPSLSDFPFPANRTQWSRVQSERDSRNRSMARERERERGDSYWPKNNDRVSAADRERQTWMRGADNIRASRSMDLPVPVGPRKTWTVGQAPQTRERASAFPTTSLDKNNSGNSPGRQTWSPMEDREDLLQSRSATLVTTPGFPNGMSRDGPRTGGTGDGSVMVRKNALTYDSEHPDRPPKFTTWLEERFRRVSPLPTMKVVQTQKPEVREKVGTRQSMLLFGRGAGAGPGGRGDSDGSRIGAAF